MKSSKNLRQQYGNSDRKGGSSKREKTSKLDRKSSRGMIYENEELRLRTININAEVERGQSDIKRLRRENEQLRREIWTLRDECDRLNKRFKAKLLDYEHGGCNVRHSGCSGGVRGSGNAACDSNCNSDDSDSCDTCKGNDDQCSDDCCTGGSCPQLAAKQPIIEFTSDLPTAPASRTDAGNMVANSARGESESSPNLHQTFDHLSVVSEETMSNADLHSHVPPTQMLHIYTPDSGGLQMTLPSLVGPLTPLTPIEQVANQLNDLQSNVPPLSYFENVLQDHMGSNIGNMSNAYSPTSKIMRHTNGWDYKLQSPFAHRKISCGTSPPALQIATLSPNTKQRHQLASPQLMTTFVSTNGTTSTTNEGTSNASSTTVTAPSVTKSNSFAIETVAITTTPAHVPPILNSPKHFFAPLKPRLKLNTTLANKTLTDNMGLVSSTATIAPGATMAADIDSSACQNCNPPDLYVHNGLASPYQHQSLPAISTADIEPPPVPQRGSSSQVSPQHRSRAFNQSQHQQQHFHQYLHPHLYTHQHQQQHQRSLQQQQTQLQSPPTLQQSIVTITVTLDDTDEVAASADAIAASGYDASAAADAMLDARTVVDDSSTSKLINSPHTMQTLHHVASALSILASPNNMPAVFVAQPNAIITKLNEPIYATAQKRCKNLITAPAVKKPLMAAIINSTKHLTPNKSNRSSATATPVHTPMRAPTPSSMAKSNLVDSQSQTESVNLETILNDIQAISEDILAIQLDKRKGNDKDISKPLEQNDKNKKPYRSEMNLTLQYDGAGQSTAANRTATATQTSFIGGSSGRCTRSLERDHTDSPSPHIPDAMMPFPDKRTYIGFDQLNNEAISVLSPASVANMQRPPLPPVAGGINRAPPQTPPVRVLPTSLNIRCAGIVRGTPVSIPQLPTEEQAGSKVPSLTPNKSQLYTAVANAAAKRAQYRSTTTHSLDMELSGTGAVVGDDGANTAEAASEALSSEAARRKARRVSIACGDSSTPDSPDPVSNSRIIRSQAQINLSGMQEDSANNITTTNSNTPTTTTTTNVIHTSISSCSDLPSALSNPALRNLKQTSHSTPNSPHSLRRRSNSNTMNPNNGVSEPTYPQSLSANTSPRHTANVHHHHTNSSCSNIAVSQQRKASQDSTRGNPTEIATVEAIAGRSRCSRRHSDGTVASNVQRNSGTSGHHHHHHHHRHQHSLSVLSNNPHHSHHSHQDSTSYSEHGTNSSASSHESSTSFSVRSHRRKLSISSHTGDKIPWCGCWGNGCL